MLVRFCWKNFLNFSENEDGTALEFSPLSGKVRQKRETHVVQTAGLNILRFCALYGANASGKSNFVKAIAFFQSVIAFGDFPTGTIDSWCRVRESNRVKPSYFELQFELDGTIYAYGFEAILSRRQIISEWLFTLDEKRNDTVLFERDCVKGTYRPQSDRLAFYLEDFSLNQDKLFLSYINQAGLKFAQENPEAHELIRVYGWLTQMLRVTAPISVLPDLTTFDDPTIREEDICRLLKSLDTGIEGFQYELVSIEKFFDEIPAQLREAIRKDFELHLSEKKEQRHLFFSLMSPGNNKRIYRADLDEAGNPQLSELKFFHKNRESLFHLGEESDGTIRLLNLLQILLSKARKVYVIDEIDRFLHPNMTYKFVSEFFKRAQDDPTLRTQLIVTSHESTLLDFDLLRRDEVWFAQKKESGDSEIYSLDQYNERFDKKIEKAYLEGRYGAVPVFSILFPYQER